MKKTLLLFLTIFALTMMILSMATICYAEEETITENDVTITQSAETADNNANIWFKEAWEKGKAWCIGAFSGVSIGSIVAVIVGVLVRRATNKGIDEIKKKTDTDTIAAETSKKLADRMSSMVLDVHINKVLESQYKVISEQIFTSVDKELVDLKKMFIADIECYEAFADFFRCSTAISDEQKKALDEKIQNAKALFETPDDTTKATIVVTAEEPKETKKKVAENY